MISLHDLRADDDAAFTDGCPARTLLGHVTSKWGTLVLAALAHDTLRWGELRRTVDGISEKMLAATLRTLVVDGLVVRDAQPVIPPRVDYRLTTRGRDLVEAMSPLLAWVAAHADEVLTPSTPVTADV